MDFGSFVDQAWNDHADDSRAVAERLHEGLALVTDESQIPALAGLAHHVYGEHLGEWQPGVAFFDRIAASPVFSADGASGQSVRRSIASLRLSQGADAGLGTMFASDRIRVVAMAAANLAERDSSRAAQMLRQALIPVTFLISAVAIAAVERILPVPNLH